MFRLTELLIFVVIIGVLVAISIPIFTGQLKKARLATNQANARAAYAAATTEYMLAYKDNAPTEDTVSYNYNTSKGQIDTTVTAGATDISTAAGLDISKWATDKASLGDKTYTVWTVTIDKNGTVTAYTAS